MRRLVVLLMLFAIAFPPVAAKTATTASAVTFPPGTDLWGYEANFSSSKINLYDINQPASPITASCVPPGSINGRGLAFDPTDGNLWYSFVDGSSSFVGDNMIHKTTPPTPTNLTCAPVTTITVTGQQLGQDDFGALDMDPDNLNYMWVAGYKPLANNPGVAGDCLDPVTGLPAAMCSYYYKVDKTTGVVAQTCKTVFKPGTGAGTGNDSLTVAKISGLGSGKVLLTDAGEIETSPPPPNGDLLAVDVTNCATVSHMTKAVGMTGIDYELGSLFASDGTQLYQLTGSNFGTVTPLGPTGAVFVLEDITVGNLTPPAPVPCEGKATGGGTTPDDKANFGFNAKLEADPDPSNGVCASGTARGELEFNDHTTGDNVHGRVDTVSFTPDPSAPKKGGKATFSGPCTVKNHNTHTSGPCANGGRFTVVAEDKDEPGSGKDTFTITYNGITRGGTIRHGNVQVKIGED